jgi:hypothetical protein
MHGSKPSVACCLFATCMQELQPHQLLPCRWGASQACNKGCGWSQCWHQGCLLGCCFPCHSRLSKHSSCLAHSCRQAMRSSVYLCPSVPSYPIHLGTTTPWTSARAAQAARRSNRLPLIRPLRRPREQTPAGPDGGRPPSCKVLLACSPASCRKRQLATRPFHQAGVHTRARGGEVPSPWGWGAGP